MQANEKGRVLLVDDEPMVLEIHTHVLQRAGFEVVPCPNGRTALARLTETPHDFDALVTDISMPGMTGVELLRQVRARDADLPVLLVTGLPSVESAAEAVELGALKYLMKPVRNDDLVQSVARATQLRRLGRAKRLTLETLGTGVGEATDRAGLEATFDHALETLWVAFQPIVQVSDRTLFGYEALMRSREPALPHPGAVLDAAERLGRLEELGRRMRALSLAALESDPFSWLLFINLHPRDLLDDALAELLAANPVASHRLVLELTERAALEGVANVAQRIQSLRRLGARIAIDDLGAGYAGLASFVQLEPDIVKLDMSLVRDADKSSTKQKLIRLVTDVCRDMNLLVVAEGIETVEERDVIVGLGCQLVQGYRFGRPAPPFVQHTW